MTEYFALYQTTPRKVVNRNRSRPYHVTLNGDKEVYVFAMTMAGLKKAMSIVKDAKAKIVPLPGRFKDPEKLIEFCESAIENGKAKGLPSKKEV